jgi:MOSC domain-containing protein YiiM
MLNEPGIEPQIKSMRVLSVNVGTPREVNTRGGPVLTSIFKAPVEGKVALRGYNLEGDRQSDLTVHGGPYKAVYAYPSEHYSYWSRELPDADLPFGMFGENLTTEGFREEAVHIGDEFQIGSAVLKVTQPRMPCYKLGIRFNRNDIIKRFWVSGRSGIYFSVVREGELEAGDTIKQVSAHSAGVSVADVVRLFKGDVSDRELTERALKAPIRGSWREGIEARLVEAL